MNKSTSKLKMGSICLISFILLCSVFTRENAFSRRNWQNDNLLTAYNRQDKSIAFNFLFYDCSCFENYRQFAYLKSCNFYYSENGLKYTYLMRAVTIQQEDADQMCITMKDKKPCENIQFICCAKPVNGTYWPDDGKDFRVQVNVTNAELLIGGNWVKSRSSYMNVKWNLPPSCKSIKSIKIKGNWIVNGVQNDKIDDIYTMNIVRSNSNTMKYIPSVLESDISDKVKVTGDAEAIIVTGAEPGENIKIYTVSGTEVKSILANDDIINIKLEKNQLYIVKAGKSRYKVAL